ncbi:hypothetical protein NE865_01560 [Phthorimaea operculella]|nr:hypothetical protein NE865_01560 [Phthorimaea operculella]
MVTERVTPGYPCPECGSCFNTKEALSLHVRLHAGDRTCVTDLCALTAALQPGLVTNTQHHNAHSQLLTWSCFNTKEALSLHVRLHAGDRTCVTDLCALTAALQPGLVANAQHHNAHKRELRIIVSQFYGFSSLYCNRSPPRCSPASSPTRSTTTRTVSTDAPSSSSGTPSRPDKPWCQSFSTAYCKWQAWLCNDRRHRQQPGPTATCPFEAQNYLAFRTIRWFGYPCPECGSCFNTKEALSLHVRLHAGDRTCVTDLCALTAALQPGLVTNAQHHNAHSQY